MTNLLRSTANPAGGHGGGVRGDNMTRRSSLFEGRFGRMFRELPPAAWPATALRRLGEAMTAEPERDPLDPTKPFAAPETDDIVQDPEENPGLPSGYTYFGQFVDHDITFDPASVMQKINDPDALVDFRTPRLDLDSMYGRGPDDQPYLFDGKKFRLGRVLTELGVPSPRRDLPRYIDVQDPDAAHRALIGDKRNDENVIVAQLHASMMQFHNKLVDEYPGASFADVQQQVRWHYQWLVVNDYLVRICGSELIDAILPGRGQALPTQDQKPKLGFYRFRKAPYMPIEFSAAAYRFGHSMIRPIYRLNVHLDGGDDVRAATDDERRRGLDGRFFIFAGVQRRGLNGFDTFPSPWAIDWSLYFDRTGQLPVGGKKRVQPSYKFDTSLVNPLGFLPEFSRAGVDEPPLTIDHLQAAPVRPTRDPANLAVRNLLRGMALELPSGQAVADAMGIARIPDERLWVGKAAEGEERKPITEVHESFANNAPLWYYILAESQEIWTAAGDASATMHLGPVGGRIVAETLIGMIAADGGSYLTQSPNWQPEVHGRRLATVGDLLAFADED